MQRLKALWSYLKEEVTINIIPAPDRKIRVIHFRRIIPVIAVFIIILTLVTLGCLYKYYQGNYLLLASKELAVEEMRQENQLMKRRYYDLNQETEGLEEAVRKLQENNNRILELLQLGLGPEAGELADIPFSYESGADPEEEAAAWDLPLEGSSLDLFAMDTRDLLLQTQVNILNIKQKLTAREEELDNLEDYARQYEELISSTPGIWPLADNGDSFISSEYGWRPDPFTGEKGMHKGLDIGVWYNTPVLATADGKVSFVGWSGGYGRLVILKHQNGYETRYGHLNGYRAKKGETVKRGQVIALSGNSGRSTGPHLHYEVRKDGKTQNPRRYIGN